MVDHTPDMADAYPEEREASLAARKARRRIKGLKRRMWPEWQKIAEGLKLAAPGQCARPVLIGRKAVAITRGSAVG